MNIYIRYFDKETLVPTVGDAIDFLESLPDIEVDDFLRKDLSQFIASDHVYPKRYKVRGRNYFIVIKTNAESMAQFKNNGNNAREAVGQEKIRKVRPNPMPSDQDMQPGWYDGSLLFKRVIPIPMTQKFQYVDTMFAARVKAVSRLDCYNKIIDHLHSRPDIDPRSQFPSPKGKNFECHYRGFTVEN